MKLRKTTKIWLVVSIIVCLVSSFVAGLIQSNFGKTDISYVRMNLTDMIAEIENNNATYGKNVEVSFGTSTSTIMFGTAASANVEFKLFVPKDASENNQLPAIVLAPGMDDTKEELFTLSTELSRRGFVVAALDKAGEGNSDLSVDSYTNGSGGTEAVIEYMMSLPYVDETRVGIGGHSNGNKFLIIALNKINLETQNHIPAFLMGQGTGFTFRFQENSLDDVKFGMVVGKNDEMDTVQFNAAVYDETDAAKSLIQEVYPEFSADRVPLGVWFTSEGQQDLAPGENVSASEARVLYNPPTTHPGMEFSRSGAAAFIDFFYGAFGVPEGSAYVASDNQIWWGMAVFQFIALIAFLSMVFPLVDVLLSTNVFRGLRGEDKQETLPAFCSPKETIPTIAMMAVLTALSALTFFPLFKIGATLLPPTTLLPLSSNFINQIAYWAMIMGLVACGVLIVAYWVKKVIAGKSTEEKPRNPFACADISLRKFLHSMLFVACLYLLTCVAIIIVRWLFKVDFRISYLKFSFFRPERIFVVLRYAVIFGIFYVVNAIITANTRFRDLSDKASTAIVCVGNVLGLAILLAVQYISLVTNHQILVSDMGSATIQVWKYLLAMLMAPMVARYIYNRTKNIWIGAAFNAIFFTAVTTGTTGITTSLGLFAM